MSNALSGFTYQNIHGGGMAGWQSFHIGFSRMAIGQE